MPITDVNSFLAGVRVGKWLKLVGVRKNIDPPIWELPIITENNAFLLTEDEERIMPEEQGWS